MASTTRLRIATYNVHKCRGLDGRIRPQRIARVVQELDADIIALQEVLRAKGPGAGADQLQAIVEHLPGYELAFGENRLHEGAAYGNAVLSRLPIEASRNYDLTWRGCERRGCLRADVRFTKSAAKSAGLLHIFNVHLGTAFMERRHQARVLNADILRTRLRGHRIVLGDFNEWTRGLATRLLSSHLQSIDVRRFQRRSRTYPGILPVLHLDHFYYDDGLHLEHFRVYRTRAALMASDHLPMIAEFIVAE